MTEHPLPNLVLLTHPLIQHKLSKLRAKDTPKKQFQELAEEIASLMAYESTRDLPLREATVETPLEVTVGKVLSGKKLVLVPILRAGLGMVEGVSRLVPGARIGHVGLVRNEDTLEPDSYYFKIPGAAEDRHFLVLDPMLATGGSAQAAVKMLKDRGARDIRFLCLVAAPEGVKAMGEAHPDVMIYAVALDRCLSREGYILPGLGDAGDRLFGTR